MSQPLLSFIILTRDEEANLAHCLQSLGRLPGQVFVVDCGSTDKTIQIAESFGATVMSHPFENHAKQINWALMKAPITAPWTMRLDADETLTSPLVEEIKTMLPQVPADVSGLMIKRRVYFMGRWIRHGGYYPTWLLRIWRTGMAICEDRWMDEHMILSKGKIQRMKYDIIDWNRKGLGFWISKHNQYASREVMDLKMDRGPEGGKLAGQAASKRWLKTKIYGRSPLFIRVFLYWAYRYIFRLGFLDGCEGLIFHFMQSFWYRFLVDAKLYEAKKQPLGDNS